MSDIGAMLREARMREHLDIAEFEARTKIRAKYLRALEDEEWSLLPGYTFTKAFLRTYADMLGLDGRLLVDEFKRQYPDPSELELPGAMPPRRDSRRDARRGRERGGERGTRARGPSAGPSGRVLLAALVVVVIAAGAYVARELTKGSSTPPATIGTTNGATTGTHHHKHKKATPPAHTPTRVGVQIAAATPVNVCLVGYVRAGAGEVHQRLPAKGSGSSTAAVDPGAPKPVYHDNHFVVSLSGGDADLIINLRKHVRVNAVGRTVSYAIGVRGGHHRLAASRTPRCST
jgi:cytoskeletal protein RodZ